MRSQHYVTYGPHLIPWVFFLTGLQIKTRVEKKNNVIGQPLDGGQRTSKTNYALPAPAVDVMLAIDWPTQQRSMTRMFWRAGSILSSTDCIGS